MTGTHWSCCPWSILAYCLRCPPALRHDGHLDSATALLRSRPLGCNVPVFYVAMVITVFNTGCRVAGSLLLGCSALFSLVSACECPVAGIKAREAGPRMHSQSPWRGRSPAVRKGVGRLGEDLVVIPSKFSHNDSSASAASPFRSTGMSHHWG